MHGHACGVSSIKHCNWKHSSSCLFTPVAPSLPLSSPLNPSLPLSPSCFICVWGLHLLSKHNVSCSPFYPTSTVRGAVFFSSSCRSADSTLRRGFSCVNEQGQLPDKAPLLFNETMCYSSNCFSYLFSAWYILHVLISRSGSCSICNADDAVITPDPR